MIRCFHGKFARAFDIRAKQSVKFNLCCLGSVSLLPPATKLGQGNIFTGVCDSVHWGGVSLSACWGTPLPPDQAGTPPGTRHPPPDQAPPPPGAWHSGRYRQRAGGMHPTGMQSSFRLGYHPQNCLITREHLL